MAEIQGDPNRVITALSEIGEKLSKGHSVRVGFLETATHQNADGSSIPTATIAALNNYGHGATPPRPFFTNMIRDKSAGWADLLLGALQNASLDARTALSLLGEHIAGDLRESIASTMSPPLSPITLMLRKMKSEDQNLIVTGATVGEAARRIAAGESYDGVSTKPLVETGQMIEAVDYEVSE